MLVKRGIREVEGEEMIRLEDVKMHFTVRKGLFSTTTMKAVDGVSLKIGTGEI